MTVPWDLVATSAEDAVSAVLVAPYIKENTLRLLLDVSNNLKSLICVTHWTPWELGSGVSDAIVREVVIGRGGDFYLHPTLHAKYFRFDDSVLVGSANITHSGLGLARISNYEILTRPAVDFDFEYFETLLLQQSRLVSDEEYEIWKSIPVIRQAFPSTTEGYVADWRPLTRDPSDVWMHYSGQASPEVPAHVRSLIESDLSALMIPAGLASQSFASWVRAALFSSAFASATGAISMDSEPIAFIQLGEDWGMNPGDARYAAETVHNWLHYFQ